MSDDDRLSDGELDEIRDQADIVQKEGYTPWLGEQTEALCDEVERLRDERQKLAEALRATVSDSDLDDWILEITDE